MEFRIRGTIIRTFLGDITDLAVEGIVNAANNRLWMGGGVAGAIKRRGGMEIEEEAVSQGPIEVGEAVVTNAGKLKAKYVIHAAVMGQDLRTDGGKIYQATVNSLRRAKEKGLKTIAFPLLGTGVGRFPVKEAIRIMLEAIRKWIKEGEDFQEIIFAVYDPDSLQIVEEEFQNFISNISG